MWDPPYVGMLSGVKLSLYGKPHLMRDMLLTCSRIYGSSHNDLVQMKRPKGFLIP